MISEERVKLMTKMAIYESGEGKKDLELAQYKRGQYVKLEVIKSIVWNTIIFWMIAGVIVLLGMEQALEFVIAQGTHKLFALICVIYIVFAVTRGMVAWKKANQEVTESIPRIQEYRRNLNNLYYLYETKAKPEDTAPEALEEKLEEELNAETI